MSKNQKASGITNIINYDNSGNISFVSGSTTLMSVSSSGAVVLTGTMSGGTADSASLSANSNLLQGTGSIGFATTASLLAVSSSQQQISASLLNVIATGATTGSNSFRANQSITGSLVVSSTITAQTLVVQTVTSSIVYSSGSNVFGNSLSNTQTFTGSVNITGSIALAGRLLIGATDDLTNALQVKGDGVFANRTNSAVTSTSILSISTGGTYGTTAAPKYLDLVFSGDNKQIAKIRSVDETGNIDGGYLMFYTSTAAGTVNQNMILHRGGNLNIGTSGTTDAGYKLDVNGTGRFSGALTVSGNLNLQGAVTRNINFYDSSNTNINAQIQYDQISSTSGQLFFGTNNAGTFATRLTIANTGAATFASSVTMGGDLVLTPNDSAISFSSGAARFFTGGQEKMRITSGNDVGFGATTITNPNSIGRVLELKLANSVGIVLNDSRDASPIGLENRGAVFHLTYGTKNLLVSDGGSGNIAIGISAAFNGERLRVGGSTSANKPAMAITSANPNVSCPNGTATTVYTFPSYPRVMFYMVFVRFDTGADANGYAAYAVVAASSVGSKLMTVVNGSAVTLTLSGLNVQINQTSGVTQNAVVSVIQIFAEAGGN